MQIILNRDECGTIHYALETQKHSLEATLPGRGDTLQTGFIKKDIKELEALIKRILPYVK